MLGLAKVFPYLLAIRELKQWQQWSLQLKVRKAIGFNNNFAHASHFFVHFFAITAWLRRESA